MNNDNVSEEAVRFLYLLSIHVRSHRRTNLPVSIGFWPTVEEGGRAEDRGDQELWWRHVRRLQAPCELSLTVQGMTARAQMNDIIVTVESE